MGPPTGATGGMLVLGIAFLMVLTAGVDGEVTEAAAPEVRRCHFCGPLAEQVHRKERSEPCGDNPRILPCDTPKHYCATVAAAPPYAESRYCVKKFREECYPIHCNTTDVWRVVCTCRGDLCNGPVTKEQRFELNDLTKKKSSNIRIIFKREAALLNGQYDTDIVNQLTTYSPKPAIQTIAEPTEIVTGDNKLENHINIVTPEDLNSKDDAKADHLASDKHLKINMNEQSDEPSREPIASDEIAKAVETTAAAMRAAIDPDQHHHEHVVMTTHSTQVDDDDDLDHSAYNQTSGDIDPTKNNAQQLYRSLTFHILAIITCILMFYHLG